MLYSAPRVLFLLLGGTLIFFFFSYIYRKVLDNKGGKKGIWGRGKG